MPSRNLKIVISTTDPKYQGGVWGVTAALIGGFKRLGFADHLKLVYASKRVHKNQIIEEQIEDVSAQTFRLRAGYGNAYISQFISSFPIRNRIGENGAINIAVGGGNQTAMPFLLARRPYMLWVSNTVDDEYEQLFKWRINQFDIKSWIKFRLYRPITRLVEKIIFDRAKVIFVESKYSMGVISKNYPVSANKLVYLPYPTTCRARPEGPACVTGEYILFVGRVDEPRKNVKMLIRAFALMSATHVRLVLAGKFQKDGPVCRLIDQLALHSRVLLAGFVDDKHLHNLLANSRAFAMPSLQEGLGNAVIEALSHGIPVVATKCGGVEDSVADGRNGFLVDINDIHSMARKLDSLCTDDFLWQRLSDGASSYIKDVHSWERFVSILRSVLLSKETVSARALDESAGPI